MSSHTFPDFDGVLLQTEIVEPKGGNGAGLVVLEGPDASPEHTKQLCEQFAAEGYIAICPSLPHTLTTDDAARTLLSVLARLRTMSGCGGKIGVLGFGRGSALAYLMAARSDVDCVVIYGSEGIEKHVDEVHDIRMPVLMHLPQCEDPRLLAAQQKLLRALKRNAIIVPAVLSATALNFYQVESPDFSPEAARAAHQKTLAFLAEHLNA